MEELERKFGEVDRVVHKNLIAERQHLVEFKAIHGWYYGFLEHNEVSNSKTRGDAGYFLQIVSLPIKRS